MAGANKERHHQSLANARMEAYSADQPTASARRMT